MNLKKVLVFVVAAIFCCAMIAGCSSTPAESSSSSDTSASTESSSSESSSDTSSSDTSGGGSSSGGSVYWLNAKPEADTVLQEVASMYTQETGTPVKVVTAASNTYQQTLNAEMAKSSPPTLFVIGTPEAVDMWSDYALNLKGTAIEEQLNTDAYNYYNADGDLVSIGYCYESFGIIVNPDLLDKAGYKVEDIKGFDDLKACVEDITARKDELGFSAFTSNDLDASQAWRFTGHLANIDYYYEQGGTEWTATPETITGDYLDNYKNLYDLAINNSTVPPTELPAGGHDAENEFKTGQAAFFIQGSWEWEAISGDVPNAKMIPYYCGVDGEEKAGLNCGTEQRWAVNKQASEADQQATIDFMVWCVTNKEASEKLVSNLGVMPYKEVVESSNGFLVDADQYTQDGCYVMNWAFNFQPNVEQYRNGLVSALNQYVVNQNDQTWENFKTAFVQGWAQQYQQAHSS